MELVTAPIAELRTWITQGFEEAVAAVLTSGAAVPPVVSDDEGKRVKAEPKRFTCGLTGGSTGLIFLGALRGASVSWSQITLYWGDERAVPPDHDDSNYALAERLLLSPLGARAPFVERMRGEAEDLRAAARDYDQRLPAALDLIILGVGDDGHVCSLFAGHPALISEERVIVIEDSPKPPPRRLTLSLPYICSSRRVWVVAVGPRKLPLLEAAISENALNTPLDMVVRRAREVTIFTDQSLRKGFVAV